MTERFAKGINDGNWPEFLGTKEQYGKFEVTPIGSLAFYDENGNYTDDGDQRFVQMLAEPDDIQLVVSGDPGRDHMIIGAENGFMGWPTSKKIELPENWNELLRKRRR